MAMKTALRKFEIYCKLTNTEFTMEEFNKFWESRKMLFPTIKKLQKKVSNK